jgi:radical SAM superfamily enzyme YgiQ (UPF0313 family)
MNKRLDILVVHPNASAQVYQDLSKNFSAIETPIWAAMIGSFLLKKGWSVELLDCEAERLSVDDAAKRVKEYNPRILCVVVYGQQPSASSQNMVGASALMGECFRFDMKRVYVGPTPTVLPDKIIKDDLDVFVVRGEGPHTLDALLKLDNYEYSELRKIPGLCYNDNLNIVKNPQAPLITNLDEDLTIDWSLLPPVSKYRTANWHSWTNNNETSPFASIYTSLGCPMQCSFCLDGETVITTAKGKNKKIKDIKIGDKIISFNIKSSKLEESTVINASKRSVNELFQIKFADGQEILATEEHPFFINGDWIQAKNLRVGDKGLILGKYDKASFLMSQNNPFQSEIVSITKIKNNQEVFNFECDINNNYFANRILTHNCMINSPFNEGSNKNNTFRHWLPENTIKTLDYLSDQGVKNLKIADEMFVLRPKHFLALCNLIIERGYKFNIWAYARIDTVKEEYLEILKKAGVNWLGLGIESGNRDIRLEVTKGKFQETNIYDITKKIRDHGICVGANYMFGLPGDTLESMEATLGLSLDLNTEYANFYCTMAYPGSQLHRDVSAKNPHFLPEYSGNPGWIGYSQHAYETLNLPTEQLKAVEVLKFRDEAFIKYYTNPSYVNMMAGKFGKPFEEQMSKMLEVNLKRKNI